MNAAVNGGRTPRLSRAEWEGGRANILLHPPGLATVRSPLFKNVQPILWTTQTVTRADDDDHHNSDTIIYKCGPLFQ